MKELLVAALCLGTLTACGGSSGGDMTEEPSAGGETDGSGVTDGGDTGDGEAGDGDTDGDSADPTLSAAILSTNAEFPANAFREEIEVSVTPSGSNGFAFETGVLSDNSGIVANARVSLGSFFPTPDPIGTATLASTYDAVMLRNPTMTNGQLEVETVRSQGAPITLTADFTPLGLATLTGTDGTLSIDGTFSRTTRSLNGSVTYQGVEGDLSGFVGGAEAFGAFAGENATSVFAGGFVSN